MYCPHRTAANYDLHFIFVKHGGQNNFFCFSLVLLLLLLLYLIYFMIYLCFKVLFH